MVARRVHSCGNKGAGFTVLANSSMTLNDCSSDRDQIGFQALGILKNEEDTGVPNVEGRAARVVLSGVLARRSTANGFSFGHCIRGCMKHCAALQCGGNEMVM